MIKLNPHQVIPVQYIRNNYGLILFHSPGSGKTLTYAARFAALKFCVVGLLGW